ncbi:MAG: MarR family winged helix-turn-helix transcriptional regulator [Solirubrobacterales bacterium]
MTQAQAQVDLELAARLRLAITRTARRLRQEAGADLGPSQVAALATVERHGPLAPSELATVERIRRPTVTRIITRLAEAGLVERTADPDDGRGALVSITAEGRALLKRLRRRKTAYLAQHLGDLDPEDAAALERAVEVLERMLEGESA